jgi:glycosyltransferase involved in cell wall biosynthesis
MKKVLINAYACSPLKGSEEGGGWSWVINVAKEGYNVWCLTNFQDKEAILAEHKKLGLPNLHFVFVTLEQGLDQFLFNPSSKKIYLHYYLWRKKACAVALKLHNDVRFDIAHHVSYGSFQQGTYLWNLHNVKVIFGPVGGGQEALPQFKDYFGSAWKFEQLRSMITRFSLRYSANLKKTMAKSDVILVTNKDTENLIKKTKYYQPEKVHYVLDSAIPPSMQHLNHPVRIPDKTLKLLWVGRMLPRKGLELVFHALSRVPAHVQYTLTVVGGGAQFALLDSWIQKYGLDKGRISIVGQIPFAEVIAYYRKSDVFIFCSLRESFGSQFNEALAFGLPVITLDMHGAAIGVPDNCSIKVKPSTKENTLSGIAAAITKFFEDVEYRQSCSANALIYSETNTWENKIAHVTSKFY